MYVEGPLHHKSHFQGTTSQQYQKSGGSNPSSKNPPEKWPKDTQA